MSTEPKSTEPKSTEPKIVPAKAGGMSDLRAEAVRARVELASTLDALEYKANVPKRLHHARQDLTRRLRKLGDENPAALLGIAAAAAAVAGTVVWLGARRVLER